MLLLIRKKVGCFKAKLVSRKKFRSELDKNANKETYLCTTFSRLEL